MNKITVEGGIGYRWHKLFLKAELVTVGLSKDIEEIAKDFLYDHADELVNKIGYRCVKMDIEDDRVTHAYVHSLTDPKVWVEFEFKEIEEC